MLCMADAGDHDCMEEAFSILKRQRDELLEALQRIASYPKIHGGELIAESMCDIAHTAIANTIGEAA